MTFTPSTFLNKVVTIAAFLVSTLSAGTAAATVVFQSDPSVATGFSDSRGAERTAVGRLAVTTTQTINGIGVLNYLRNAGSLKFFIANADTGAIEYISGPKAFTADTGAPAGTPATTQLSYKLSDDFSFTFNSGTTYAVGSIADVATFTYADFGQTNSANGFSSLLRNINVNNFTNPSIATAQVCCSIGFELLASPSNNVPEPASIALLSLGMLGFAASRRKSAK